MDNRPASVRGQPPSNASSPPVTWWDLNQEPSSDRKWRRGKRRLNRWCSRQLAAIKRWPVGSILLAGLILTAPSAGMAFGVNLFLSSIVAIYGGWLVSSICWCKSPAPVLIAIFLVSVPLFVGVYGR